jgi:hypothetical protein
MDQDKKNLLAEVIPVEAVNDKRIGKLAKKLWGEASPVIRMSQATSLFFAQRRLLREKR